MPMQVPLEGRDDGIPGAGVSDSEVVVATRS